MTNFLSTRSAFTLAALALAAIAGGACSSSTSGTGTSGGTSGSSTTTGTPASSADCASRCEKKFTSCGGDDASAKSNCASQVCNASPTSEQLTCLENKACNDIASASSFASLCPASTTPAPSPTTPSGGGTCGSATCASGEYCSLSYDSSTKAWTPSGCKKIPATCTSSGASSLCTCMKDNSGCPTSGIVNTKCSQSDGTLQFGCD